MQSPGAPGSTEVDKDARRIDPQAILDQPDDLSEDGNIFGDGEDNPVNQKL